MSAISKARNREQSTRAIGLHESACGAVRILPKTTYWGEPDILGARFFVLLEPDTDSKSTSVKSRERMNRCGLVV